MSTNVALTRPALNAGPLDLAAEPSLSDIEVDLVRTAVNSLLMSCENALSVAAWPGVPQFMALELVQMAETTYAAALELIDDLVVCVDDDVDLSTAAPVFEPSAPVATADWVQMIKAYDHIKKAIQVQLEKAHSALANDGASTERWAASRVAKLAKLDAGWSVDHLLGHIPS